MILSLAPSPIFPFELSTRSTGITFDAVKNSSSTISALS